MGNKSIFVKFTMAMIIVIVFSSCTMAESVCAQSDKPSPPQFTARLVYATYNVSVTNQVDNSSIEFRIKNQPFTASSIVNAIYYLIQIRNPAGNWSPIYSTDTYHIQSNGTYTILNFPISGPNLLPPNMRNAPSVDFQLQAQTGYYSQEYIQGQMPDASIKTPGYWEINFNPAEKSDWSNTQTVNLNQTSTASTTPTVPELSLMIILPLFLSILLIVVLLSRRMFSGSHNNITKFSQETLMDACWKKSKGKKLNKN